MAQNQSIIDQNDIEVTIHIRTTDQNEGGYMYDVWLASPEQAQVEEYSMMLQRESDYLASAEAVDESILANEYTFTKDGKRFG